MRRIISLMAVITLTAALFVACEKVEPEVANYREQTKEMQKVDLAELQKKIKADENSYIYIGRENCPYCVKLVPEILDLQDKLKIKFAYLDVLKSDEKMDKFFDDNKLEYVPSLLKVGRNKVYNIPLDYDYVKKHGSYNTEELSKQLETLITESSKATKSN